MKSAPEKILVLSGRASTHAPIAESLRAYAQVVEMASIDKAIDALRSERFDAIFSDAADFLPLERALVSQQANLVLNTVGEGVCIVDGEGRCNWMNKKMQAWPAKVHEKVRRTLQEAYELFGRQVSPPSSQSPDTPSFSRSKRYALNIEDQHFLEMIASPVISPAGEVVQVVAVIWDATSTRRLQQKIDAIDKAGNELVRLEADAMEKMHVGQRLKLLEDKIVRYVRELMHFDHFAIRLLDRNTKKLEIVISAGLPPEALAVEMLAEAEGNGISGYVAATGRSYICADVQRDPRYIMGLHEACSSLTVPLRLHDKVIGIFNIESRSPAAFTEDDRQFAEIFGRYVAIALNILDLMVVERVSTSHKVADNVCTEAAGPLNDIASDANQLLEEYIGHDDLRHKLQQILDNVSTVQKCLRQAAQGSNTTILGASEMSEPPNDPVLAAAHILVADDEPNIRDTLSEVLRKYCASVTVAINGVEAVHHIQRRNFHLIISDIKMPDRSGYEVFAAARQKSATVPVILMTGFGYDPNHSIVRASQEGLHAVLFKPFKVNQLLAEVRKALQAVAAAE